jgi:lactate racemase
MELLYGKERVTLNLPANMPWRILNPTKITPLDDPEAAISRALHNPIGLPPFSEIFKPGKAVCLLVNDSTRDARSDILLPPLIKELKQMGVGAADIFIVFANGNHRLLTYKEMSSLVGPGVASEIAMYNHDSRNDQEMVYLGETTRGTPVYVNEKVVRADRRILTGSIVYHFFAGFGGGRKALVPGVSGWETIKINHSLMLNERAQSGILEGNPVHEDLLEAAKLVGGDFLLNVVLNEEKEILGVFAGHMVQAHQEGCRMVRQVYGTAIDEQADVVIASCGGYPKDINLYQAQKTLDNAVQAVKEGGRLILLAQCSEGTGSAVYEEWACRYHSLVELKRALLADFQLGGHKAFAVARSLQKCTTYLVSQLHPEMVRRLGFIPAASLDEAIDLTYAGLGKKLVTYIIPQGALTVPFF